MVMPIAKVRQLWSAYISGLTAGEASRRTGVKHPTVMARYKRFREGFIPEFKITGPIAASLERRIVQRWRQEARVRDMSVYQLVRQIIIVVANDNLFNAVLGEPQDGPRKLKQRKETRTIIRKIRQDEIKDNVKSGDIT